MSGWDDSQEMNAAGSGMLSWRRVTLFSLKDAPWRTSGRKRGRETEVRLRMLLKAIVSARVKDGEWVGNEGQTKDWTRSAISFLDARRVMH